MFRFKGKLLGILAKLCKNCHLVLMIYWLVFNTAIEKADFKV